MKIIHTDYSSFFRSILYFIYFGLIFSLGFLQPFQIIYGQRIPFTDLLFLVLVGYWLCLIIFKQFEFKWHKFYWILMLYLIAIFISIFVSPDKIRSFIKFAGEIYLVGLAVITFNLVDNLDLLKKVLQIWLFAAITVCMIGLISISLFYFLPDFWLLKITLFHYGAVPVGNYPRINSTFISASMLCNYLSVSLVFLLICRKMCWINSILYHLLLPLILINSIFTISSGLGAIPLILCFWFWYTQKENLPKFSFFTLVIGIFFSIAFFFLNFVALQKYPSAPFAFTIPILGNDIFLSSRYLVWRDSLQTFFENPLLGVGIGQNSCEIVFQNTEGTFSLLTDAHNIFLSIATQTGILGLIALLLIIYFLIKEFYDSESKNKISIIRLGLGLAFVCAFIYQGFLGSFEDTRHLWVLIGLILSFGNSGFKHQNLHINL